MKRAVSQHDGALRLDTLAVGEGDRREEEPRRSDLRHLLELQLSGKVFALHLFQEAHSVYAHNQHAWELMLLVFIDRDVCSLAPELMQQTSLEAFPKHHIGELVVADVELDRIEMAGVVDVAAFRDREPAGSLATTPGILARLQRSLVAELRDLGRSSGIARVHGRAYRISAMKVSEIAIGNCRWARSPPGCLQRRCISHAAACRSASQRHASRRWRSRQMFASCRGFESCRDHGEASLGCVCMDWRQQSWPFACAQREIIPQGDAVHHRLLLGPAVAARRCGTGSDCPR